MAPKNSFKNLSRKITKNFSNDFCGGIYKTNPIVNSDDPFMEINAELLQGSNQNSLTPEEVLVDLVDKLLRKLFEK